MLALDPGKTTGWSFWEYGETTPATCLKHGQVEDGLDGYLEHIDKMEADIIVAEQFILDGRTPNPDVTPLKIEGALASYSHGLNVPLVLQRNNFKKHVSNELLKEHGLYWKGEPHAMDSARHALAYLKTQHHYPTLEKYFMLN